MGAGMKKILILEDNPNTLEYLRQLSGAAAPEAAVFAFDNVKDAYCCAMEREIDLFLADIILRPKEPGDVSGISFIDNIRKVSHYEFTPVLFITSMEDTRLFAYEKLHCAGFIEKPFDGEKVKEMISWALRFPSGREADKTLYFRRDGVILSMERSELVYAESVNHRMMLHHRNGDVLEIPYLTVQKLLAEADSGEILQCARGVVVNRRYVESVDLANRVITLKGRQGRLEIGVMFKKKIKELWL